jgi:hypothetical protein
MISKETARRLRPKREISAASSPGKRVAYGKKERATPSLRLPTRPTIVAIDWGGHAPHPSEIAAT